MISGDFVCRYLFTYRRESRGSRDSSDTEEEVPTGWRSFPQPYAFEPTSASMNYHEEAESETTGSNNGFQGVDLEVADRTLGTYLIANGKN